MPARSGPRGDKRCALTFELPADIKLELKRRALERGIPLKEYCQAIMRRAVGGPRPRPAAQAEGEDR
jgi:hypothetical protein